MPSVRLATAVRTGRVGDIAKGLCRRERLIFGLYDPENAADVCKTEGVLHGRAQAEEDECGLQTLGVFEHLDQGGDAGTIDIAKVTQIQCKRRLFAQQVEQGLS